MWGLALRGSEGGGLSENRGEGARLHPAPTTCSPGAFLCALSVPICKLGIMLPASLRGGEDRMR